MFNFRFAADVHRAMGCDQKKLYTSVEVTPAPVQFPTQAACPEIHSDCKAMLKLYLPFVC